MTQPAEPPTDTTAAIEMWARLLNSADVHVYGNECFTWAQLSPASQDQYRKVAEWLMGRVIMPPEVLRAKYYREAADAIDADMERFFVEWPDEPRNSPYANGRKDAANDLRRMADGSQS